MHFASPITLNGPGGNPTFSQPLWTIDVGPHVYTFVSHADQTILDTTNINTIAGTGTVTDSLDGDTANGTYNLSFNVTSAGPGATFTWNGTTGAAPPVPEPSTIAFIISGSTLAAAIYRVRRRLRG